MTPGDSTIVVTEERPLPDDAPVPLVSEDPPPATEDPLRLRRADVDAKLAALGDILPELGCEAVVLFMPPHVSWACGGFNTRGLFADTERPGLFTNGRQRWLLCSNLDTQRLFDEELDRLGFQLKEWHWTGGRAALLGELTAGKKVAADRPFPNMPLINERLRTVIRPLTAADRVAYAALGRLVAHAVEATARGFQPGETEQELAGQVAHRLFRHGVEVAAVSVSGQARGVKYPRPGATDSPVEGPCRILATGQRDGLYVTAARTVAFGPVADAARRDHDSACKLAAVYRSLLMPGESLATVAQAGHWLVHNSSYEFDHRGAQLGYGTGRVAAEELRRLGQDEPFVAHQAVVTQAKCGGALIADTVLIGDAARPVTPCTEWPFKRVKIKDVAYDVPEMLVRRGSPV